MDRKLVIVQWNNKILTAVYEDEQLVEFLFDEPAKYKMGDIYVGKVKNVVKNINAAFVEYANGECGYYSLTDNTIHHYTSLKAPNKALACGDELIVQIQKEPIKTKPALLDGHLNFTGQYLVLTVGKTFVGVSSKITNAKLREQLKAWVTPYVTTEFGFVVRTQAQYANCEQIVQEIKALILLYEQTMHRGKFSTCYSQIYVGLTSYMQYIHRYSDVSKITTDIPWVRDELNMFLVQNDRPLKVTFYEDKQWPLLKLKSLETHLSRALSPRVWLKSGGSLVIQPTEAMVVIDVNTGRFVGKKNSQETFYKINLEAAKEIGRQLRLRNLSGIIMIDFINMQDDAMDAKLMAELRKILEKDPIKTSLIDMTRLKIVEMTRKKERKPLHEHVGSWKGIDVVKDDDHYE